MANDEHVQILKQGTEEWNRWRNKHPSVRPDLEGADLTQEAYDKVFSYRYLHGPNLEGANLQSANFIRADLRRANMRRADLRGADLSHADLQESDLTVAQLRGGNLSNANLSHADLTGTDLSSVTLAYTNLNSANLSNAKLDLAVLRGTIFVDIDLSNVRGIENVQHHGPCGIDISTIYRSEGKLPERFLRGCGIPDEFITQIPSFVAAVQPIQFYSCFISYSSKDEEFARRLHSRMRDAGLRVWFAPEDIKGGEKLYEQIDHAIQVYDRLLLVISESSLHSRWVELEIRRARNVELKEGRRKLFPIRLASYESLQHWVCLNSATGEDLAEEVRSYFIPDFSNWKSHDDFEEAFSRMLSDLKESTR